tara:strand:+ start:416 stop:2821 length:2406 start_codon:yes stop_codon:yes gene_type:complete
MGDKQITNKDWSRAADSLKGIASWGKDFATNTLKDTKGPWGVVGAGYRNLAKSLAIGSDEGFASGFKTMKPSLSTLPTAAVKGMVDIAPSIGQFAPGRIGEASHSYLRRSQYNDPGLRTSHFIGGLKAPVGTVAKGLGRGVKGIKSLANIGKTSMAARAAKIGPIADRGLKGWFNKGLNQRVPNESTASFFGKAGLFADDAAQVGKFTDEAGNVVSGLGTGYLAGIPKNARQLKQLATGKGGITWSGGAGVPTGPTALGRQVVSRPLRTLAAAGDVTKAAVKGLPGAIGTTARTIPAAVSLAAKTGSMLPPAVQAQTGAAALRHPVGQWATDGLTNLGPDHWANQWASQQLRQLTEGGVEYAKEQKGFKGIVSNLMADRVTNRLDAGNIAGASKAIVGSMDLATKYGGDIPTAWGYAKGKAIEGWNAFTGRDRQVESVRQGQVLGFDNQRKVDTARQFDNTYSRGGTGKQALQEYDINKIGNTTANEYLESGSAAYDEDMLVDFWNRQNQLNAAADQRLLDIQNDRSIYNNMLQSIQSDSQVYEDELARLQPYGQQYSDELARLQPIGQQYSDELARLQPYDKQYSDELARLQPFDKQFTSSLSELTKGRDELRGYQGKDLHPDDVAFLKTELPAYDKAISDLQTQYKQYQTDVSDLTTARTDYQKYLGEVQTGQKDYQKYLGEVQGVQKDYQKYLGEVQTSQKALSDYGTSVKSDLGDLENYATAFSDARKASDEAARSYTVQSQQGIASGLKQGVAGIRAARGYRTVGSNRNKSAKRRWNRDFRVRSFGEGGGVPPINI